MDSERWQRARRYRRRLAEQIREARAGRFGSQGAASDVRLIDPANYRPPPAKAAIARPPSKQFIDTGSKWALEREADRLLKRTGRRRDAMLTQRVAARRK